MLRSVQLKSILQRQPTDTLDWGLVFVDNDCVTLPLVFALHGIQPGIHKVSHLLCITMSKTFTVLERMPCSHTTAPLAMIPAQLMKLSVPRRTPLVKALLAAHNPHQEGLHFIGLSPHTWFCTVCYFGNERASLNNSQLLFLLVLVRIQEPRRSLQGQRLPGRAASQWSSSEPHMTGHFMTCWNAHPGVLLFQTSHLRSHNIPSFKHKKERTVASSQRVALMLHPEVKTKPVPREIFKIEEKEYHLVPRLPKGVCCEASAQTGGTIPHSCVPKGGIKNLKTERYYQVRVLCKI